MKKILIATAFFLFGSLSWAEGLPLSGFKFRKAVYIQGTEQDLRDYQVNIKVGEGEKAGGGILHCDGLLERDFMDVRWISQDGRTPLPYYREFVRGKAPRRLASFWLKVPRIPAHKKIMIYLYYGNSRADDLSSGKNVFDLFDDFSDGSLNNRIWKSKIDEGGNLRVANSHLNLSNGEITARRFDFRQGIIEYSAAVEGSGAIGLVLRKRDVFYSSAYNGAEHCIAIGGIVQANDPSPILFGFRYNYRLIVDNGAMLFERYNENFEQRQARVSFSSQEMSLPGWPGNKYANSKKDNFTIGLRSIGGESRSSPIYYDWLRVRKYANPGPRVYFRETSK
ncbi:MAG: DUF2341 domain-containing protein [Candidatus Omnitrophota bacterium]